MLQRDEIGLRADGSEHLASAGRGRRTSARAAAGRASTTADRCPSILPAMQRRRSARPRATLAVRGRVPVPPLPGTWPRVCRGRPSGPSASPRRRSSSGRSLAGSSADGWPAAGSAFVLDPWFMPGVFIVNLVVLSTGSSRSSMRTGSPLAHALSRRGDGRWGGRDWSFTRCPSPGCSPSSSSCRSSTSPSPATTCSPDRLNDLHLRRPTATRRATRPLADRQRIGRPDGRTLDRPTPSRPPPVRGRPAGGHDPALERDRAAQHPLIGVRPAAGGGRTTPTR